MEAEGGAHVFSAQVVTTTRTRVAVRSVASAGASAETLTTPYSSRVAPHVMLKPESPNATSRDARVEPVKMSEAGVVATTVLLPYV